MFSQCPLQFSSSKAFERLASFQCPVDTRDSSHDRFPYQNFLRLCRLSPSGMRVLTVDEMNVVRIFSLDPDIYNFHRYYASTDELDERRKTMAKHPEPSVWRPVCQHSFGENIYDVVWTPASINTNNKENSFILTMRDHPIQLVDSESGRVLEQYIGHNQLDELETSHSLACSPSHPHLLYAGAERKIRVFDLNRPGNNPLFTLMTSKTKYADIGQKGIISCLSFRPDMSGCFAAGSYGGNSVSIYSENYVLPTTKNNMNDIPTSFGGKNRTRGHDDEIDSVYLSGRIDSYGASFSLRSIMDVASFSDGITSLQWSPCGTYLWVAVRRQSRLICLDMRQNLSVIFSIERSWSNALKTSFSLDPWGSFLTTGDSEGGVCVFDTRTGERVQRIDHCHGKVDVNHSQNNDNQEYSCKTSSTIKQYTCQTTVGACLIHPFAALLVTISGDRHFQGDFNSSTDSENENEDESKVIFGQKRPRTTVDEVIHHQDFKSELVLWALHNEPIVFNSAEDIVVA
jgi:telomerase Cajal body protein 1